MRHGDPVAWILAAAVAAMAGSPPAPAAEQAGVAAAVRGRVEIAERAGAVGRLVRSGEPIFLGNAVASGPDAGMQIILLDETTFTIGPNSAVTIDEFVYDTRSRSGKVTASVAKGVFRFVTGHIVRTNPGAMRVNLPVGTIGIRGTAGLGQAGNGTQQVALLGPGGNTDTGSPGGLDLSAGGLLVSLVRAGFGSTLLGDGTWGPPSQFSAETISRLLAALQAAWTGQGAERSPNQQAANAAGESLAEARRRVAALFGYYDTILFAELVGTQEAVQNRDRIGALSPTTTYEQLRAVATGTAYWQQSGVAIVDQRTQAQSGSTYALTLGINFGDRTVGGGNSRVVISTGGTIPSGTALLGAQNFTGLGGPANLTFLSTYQSKTETCGGPCRIKLDATPMNNGGIIANTLDHTLSITRNNGTALGTGSGTTGPRQAGLAP